MRAQLASYEASRSRNSRPSHDTEADHGVQELPTSPPEPWEIVQSADAPNPQVNFPTQPNLKLCIDDTLYAAVPTEVVDPSAICNRLPTEYDAATEDQSKIFSDLPIPSESSITDSQSQHSQIYGCSYPQDSSFDLSGDVTLAAPMRGTETAIHYPSSMNALDPLANVTADFVNAQNSAYRSAEWYAKAAEVGITVAKMRYNAWLASSSLWPQCSSETLSNNPSSNTVGVAAPENLANGLTSAAFVPQPLDSLHSFNSGMFPVW